MAYSTSELFEKAVSVIQQEDLFFIEDIIAYLPCHKSTFYEHFPNESDDYKEMVRLLEINRVKKKVSMRSKWYESSAPPLQLALMKLIATPDELRKLSMQYQESDERISITWNEEKTYEK